MRNSNWLLLTTCLLLRPIALAGADYDPPSVKDKADLSALVQAWIDAEVSDDRAVLEQILHEDFLSTFASGSTVGRDAYLDLISDLDISPFSVKNEAIRIHGQTAVVIDVSDNGTTKFTWVAVKQEDRWRVVAQTFSTIKSP